MYIKIPRHYFQYLNALLNIWLTMLQIHNHTSFFSSIC